MRCTLFTSAILLLFTHVLIRQIGYHIQTGQRMEEKCNFCAIIFVVFSHFLSMNFFLEQETKNRRQLGTKVKHFHFTRQSC